jgi:hypothetical protein
MWASIQEYFGLILLNARTYIGGGPLFLDRVLQTYSSGYRGWASAHGPTRRRVVWSVALVGLVWAQFQAFLGEHAEHGNAIHLARERLDTIQGADGKGGLKQDVADLRSELDAKDKELQAVKASKVQTKYVQVPAAPVTVHVDAAGAYVQPHLSDTQKAELREALQPLVGDFGKKPFIVYMSNFERSGIYAREFMRVLKAAGINAIGPELAGSTKEEDRGVMVGLHDPGHPSELSKRFMAALKSAGIEPQPTRWGDPDEPVPALEAGQLDFDLFIVE